VRKAAVPRPLHGLASSDHAGRGVRDHGHHAVTVDADVAE
jgi:hypothetical protein